MLQEAPRTSFVSCKWAYQRRPGVWPRGERRCEKLSWSLTGPLLKGQARYVYRSQAGSKVLVRFGSLGYPSRLRVFTSKRFFMWSWGCRMCTRCFLSSLVLITNHIRKGALGDAARLIMQRTYPGLKQNAPRQRQPYKDGNFQED